MTSKEFTAHCSQGYLKIWPCCAWTDRDASERHLMLLAWMVAELLLSQSVCFDRWKHDLSLGCCLISSWQQRFQPALVEMV